MRASSPASVAPNSSRIAASASRSMLHAGELHARQDRNERHLDLAEEVGQSALGQLRLERGAHEQRGQGLAGRAARHGVLLGAGLGADRRARAARRRSACAATSSIVCERSAGLHM